MKHLNFFTNKYALSKTLRFELIPQGETLTNIENNNLINQDEQLKKDYEKVKVIIDDYHREVIIEGALADVYLTELGSFASLYYKTNKEETDLKELDNIQTKLRKEVVKLFVAHPRYKTLFKKELITKDLPELLPSEEDKKLVAKFNKFTTYFTGFNDNRKNVYTVDAISTSITNRLIHENLPKYLDNLKIFEKITATYDIDFGALEIELEQVLHGLTLKEIFTVEYFNQCLNQTGIDVYNNLLGGISKNEGKKVQGLNEYINLYRQKEKLKARQCPNLKPLHKQILSDRSTASFVLDNIEDDAQLLSALKLFFEDFKSIELNGEGGKNLFVEFRKLFIDLANANAGGVFVKNGQPLTDISQKVFGSWSVIKDAFEYYYTNYMNIPKGKKPSDTYLKKKNKWLKSPYFSFKQLNDVLELYLPFNEQLKTAYTEKVLADYFAQLKVDDEDLIEQIHDAYQQVEYLLSKESLSKRSEEKKKETTKIKTFLDKVMNFYHFVKVLETKQVSVEKDEGFYAVYEQLMDKLTQVIPLYNQTRNFLTKKDYSTDKFKLNFENSSFFHGWGVDYDTKACLLFKKDGLFYLGIVDRKFSIQDKEKLTNIISDKKATRVIYDFQKPDNKNTPRLFIRSKGTSYAPAVVKYNLPIEDVIDIYDNGYFKTEFRKVDPVKYKKSLVKMIEYFKIGFSRHDSYKHYDFQWKESSEYEDISQFYHDVIISCYDLKEEEIDYNSLTELVKEGKIYLFQIYNKDFSKYSKGKPNLHTMYWKALFEKENLKDVVYKLNGQAEVFYRRKSIEYTKEELKKGHHAQELKGRFNYAIVKDRRFAFDKFQFHVPITLNFKASSNPNINVPALEFLQNNPSVKIIGLDRGERHLLYLSLINQNGEIEQQFSLNEIVNEYKGNEYKTNYHKLLNDKEVGRKQARENWGTIENIKELKAGYLSQVVHKVVNLMVEHNAIVVMEDLNFGFKRGRQKVEKQIYQKFEKMLIDKLNYLVFKDKEANKPGGVLNALQLASKFESFAKMKEQSGFIFYVPAFLTSKIDPVTGFVDQLKSRYESVDKAQEYFGQFESIHFNKDKKWFEFSFDYKKFKGTTPSKKSKWTVCTTPHERYRWNKTLNLNKGGYDTLKVTEELELLFGEYAITYGSGENLMEQICAQEEKPFFAQLLKLLSVTASLRQNNGETGDKEKDFILASVSDEKGRFFNSEEADETQPKDADANGAYHIALKGLWILDQLNTTNHEDLRKVNLAIKNADWLDFAQSKPFLK